MKKTFILLVLILLAVSVSADEVKKADLAGKWYPGSREELSSLLESYLNNAEAPSINGDVIAILAPHAGYPYSGPIAAYSFKAVGPDAVKTVIIIGFSHRLYYSGIAVFDGYGFETPLGIAAVDRTITKLLIAEDEKIYHYPEAFAGENSVEMMIPLLQTAFKDSKIVLIAIGEQSFENCKVLGNALGDVLKNRDNFVIVGSTDMCHYLKYEDANAVDAGTIDLIREFDPEKLYAKSSANKHRLLCGYGAVCATMIAAKDLGADTVEVLKYANSGDTAGDKKKVVGYLSAAFVESEDRGQKSEDRGEKNMLNDAKKKKLLKLARDTINHYLKTGKKLEVKEDDSLLNEEMGAFVTLHKDGALRGCIGNMTGKGPFYLTVRDMAVQAAFSDPRFPPVSREEMADIDIEISALSLLERIEDSEKIVMGKHGVIVKSGFRSGVYLPQVATETGWDREQFMSSLCAHKAGLPSDAWKKGNCEIYIFTAEVFGEKGDTD